MGRRRLLGPMLLLGPLLLGPLLLLLLLLRLLGPLLLLLLLLLLRRRPCPHGRGVARHDQHVEVAIYILRATDNPLRC